ncbi:hypothetical protein SOP93_11300 [Peribacillus frigoritolerans]|nr:hypothetical protein [Peribacillus frigoritolerans]MEB2491755.1 hypothetical protein [Peribacillus frigoritolerans]
MEEKKVAWLELFYDLLFATVSVANHVLLQPYSMTLKSTDDRK